MLPFIGRGMKFSVRTAYGLSELARFRFSTMLPKLVYIKHDATLQNLKYKEELFEFLNYKIQVLKEKELQSILKKIGSYTLVESDTNDIISSVRKIYEYMEYNQLGHETLNSIVIFVICSIKTLMDLEIKNFNNSKITDSLFDPKLMTKLGSITINVVPYLNYESYSLPAFIFQIIDLNKEEFVIFTWGRYFDHVLDIVLFYPTKDHKYKLKEILSSFFIAAAKNHEMYVLDKLSSSFVKIINYLQNQIDAKDKTEDLDQALLFAILLYLERKSIEELANVKIKDFSNFLKSHISQTQNLSDQHISNEYMIYKNEMLQVENSE